jgi:zinc transporter 9
MKSKPANISFFQHCKKLRDPTTAAVLMEDGAATFGVLVAGTGIAISQYSHMIVWDSLAGLTVAGMLGTMGLYLARLNQRFLLGQSVDTGTLNCMILHILAIACVGCFL